MSARPAIRTGNAVRDQDHEAYQDWIDIARRLSQIRRDHHEHAAKRDEDCA
jgi:hypothetical protein